MEGGGGGVGGSAGCDWGGGEEVEGAIETEWMMRGRVIRWQCDSESSTEEKQN